MAARTHGTSSCPATRRSFAGLWACNRKLDITICTIITQAAGEPMREIHDRQPVILEPGTYDAWLDPATPAA